jgi:glycosyltransferase involved in cell wall biosynthesis
VVAVNLKEKHIELKKYLCVVVMSKDHQDFIRDCLYSIYREFQSDLEVVVNDVNSKDNTIFESIKIAKELGLNLTVNSISYDAATLVALKEISNKINTRNIILISADDALNVGYSQGIFQVLQEIIYSDIVVNFPLIVTDRVLTKKNTRASKWSKSLIVNKYKLSIGNPGNITGSLLPWHLVKKELSTNALPNTLIEDYWLWWKLVDKVKFINSPIGEVLYRQHESNTTGMRSSSQFAGSLGFSCGIPMISSNLLFFKLLSLSLIVRWIRHLKITVWKAFFLGYLNCIRNKQLWT